MTRNYEVLNNPASSLGIKPVKGWTKGVPVEDEAKEQLNNVAAMPFVFKHVAVMPDAHWGMGACVGSVIPSLGAIMPAAVGVDIGCGMVASRLDISKKEIELGVKEVYDAIKKAVPTGRTDNGSKNDIGNWIGFPYVTRMPGEVAQAWQGMAEEHAEIVAADPELKQANHDIHLGTLGTGNHFIELAEDETGLTWVVIHSGSRGIGGRIGMHFTKLAKQQCERWYIDLPDPNLAYLPRKSDEFKRYWRALQWAQRYAKMNRALMLTLTLDALAKTVGNFKEIDRIDCHHNYASYETHFGQKGVIVTRKGAIRAQVGDRGIIPGSMGERSFIITGKGNREAFNSASHGAGRVMSRTKAKQEITVTEHKLATVGVYCNKTAEVIDESPAAYKDIEAVMAAQASLVTIDHTLKAFVNVKGVSEGRKKRKRG
jgi:tRNA-splicing ligase RtcB